MGEPEYIVTKSQILYGVRWALEQSITNNTIIKELMVEAENEIETILEDDCDEYVNEKALQEVIEKQNGIIEKLSKKLEDVFPKSGWAVVNLNGNIYKCIIVECEVNALYPGAGRDPYGWIIPTQGRQMHTFKVVEEIGIRHTGRMEQEQGR